MEYCFYLDWKGMTASEWAAWVQAIFSVIAIIAAGLFPAWQEKRARQRRVDVYVNIVADAASLAHQTLRFLESAVGHVIRSSERTEWATLCKLLESIPFHDVPDYQLYGVIRDTARASARIRDVYEPLLTSEHESVTEQIVNEVHNQALALEGCYEAAAEVSNRLAGYRLRRAWRESRESLASAWRRFRKAA